jgi:hypothetical protein
MRALFALSLGAAVGAIVFFSFLAAPAIFRAVPRTVAGDVTSAIFPRYYVMLAVCLILALMAVLAAGNAFPSRRVLAGMLLLALAVTAISGTAVRGRAHRERTAIRALPEGAEKASLEVSFRRTHAVSAALNLAILLLAAGSLAAGIGRSGR